MFCTFAVEASQFRDHVKRDHVKKDVFSTVFLSMGGGDVVADLMIGGGLNRWMVLAIMMFIVFAMGMFIDWAAILLITVPVFMPIVMELEFDPLWFSLLMCVNLQTSFVPPPFGYALFYFAGSRLRGTRCCTSARGSCLLSFCSQSDYWSWSFFPVSSLGCRRSSSVHDPARRVAF